MQNHQISQLPLDGNQREQWSRWPRPANRLIKSRSNWIGQDERMRLFSGTPWDTQPKCDRCEQALEQCDCPPEPGPVQPELPPEKHRLSIRREKRKKGKVVTVVSGWAYRDVAPLQKLLGELKARCGTGGTLEGGTLVLQGDLSERVATELRGRGFVIKSLG